LSKQGLHHIDFIDMKTMNAHFFLNTGYDQMIETTLSQLRQLKLSGMASALQTQRDQPGTYEGLAFAERLQGLVDHEDLARNQRKQERLTRAAQFKLKASCQRP
jgi:DNA replication protein DnaC